MSLPSSDFGYYFSVGLDVLASEIHPITKVIRLQTGDASTGTPDADASELWQQPGFSSLPAPPTPGETSCQTLVLVRGDRDIVFAARDTRASSIYGNLKPGETCVHATSGQARTIYKANGTIVHYTTADNTASGQSVAVYVGPDAIRLTNQHGGITIDASGITLTTGAAALTLSPTGIAKLLGQQVAVQGAVAAIAGTVATCIGPKALPTAPAPGPNSALCGLTGVAAAPSTNVFISLTP